MTIRLEQVDIRDQDGIGRIPIMGFISDLEQKMILKNGSFRISQQS